MAASMNIDLRRNEDWARLFTVSDPSTGLPLDISDWAFQMQVKTRVDNNTTIAAAAFETVDGLNGKFQATLLSSEGSALNAYGSPIQTENLAYDIRATLPSGLKRTLVSGVIILGRGVSQNG